MTQQNTNYNELITGVIGFWGGVMSPTQVDNMFKLTISDMEFRLVRKTARARSTMLFKAGPAKKLIGRILGDIQAAASTGEDEATLIKLISDNVGESFVGDNGHHMDNLFAELVSWCEWKNPSTDNFEPLSGSAYEVVMGKCLYLQFAIVAAVVQVNFIEFFLKESSGYSSDNATIHV